jgi:hypothetical protein
VRRRRVHPLSSYGRFTSKCAIIPAAWCRLIEMAAIQTDEARALASCSASHDDHIAARQAGARQSVRRRSWITRTTRIVASRRCSCFWRGPQNGDGADLPASRILAGRFVLRRLDYVPEGGDSPDPNHPVDADECRRGVRRPVGPIAALILKSEDRSFVNYGQIIGITGFVIAISNFVPGWIAERFGRLRVFLWGLIAATIFHFVMACMPDHAPGSEY